MSRRMMNDDCGGGGAESSAPRALRRSERASAASCGAMLTALAVTPFDVAKTRMQVDAARAVSFSLPAVDAAAVAARDGHNWAMLGDGSLDGCLQRHARHDCARICRDARMSLAGAFSQPGALSTLSRIARHEGVAGLYAGLSPKLAMIVPNTVLYFQLYEELHAWMRSPRRSDGQPQVPAALAPALAGTIARAVSTTVVAPFELARTQLQAMDGARRGLYFESLRNLVRTDGVRGLWRGLAPTLWRDVPFAFVYWACYEHMSGLLKAQTQLNSDKSQDRLARALAAGLGAGALAALVTTPMDVVKTRQMVDDVFGVRARHGGTVASLLKISEQEGPRALFVGAAPRLLKVAPGCAIMIGTYEYAKALLET
ncbi:mitochondrial carrier domain-containing protein [Pelagophyceae sp. CCMP2097]|nr:mitochondrial carrier domain-containing protein [Pelagophyceae sp. CCMP2097]|mmetsp:Transcript_27756/g.95511  ORF Transcript_27756/g.95511 Transcript_27756/m.95511 type:complete len:371 (-) Transcript_27756:292-1404(-)